MTTAGVLILSKTQMTNNKVCVGGVLTNGRLVRLLDPNGHNQDANTNLSIGEVYIICFKERSNKVSPHIEDILVIYAEFKFRFSSSKELISYLNDKLKVKIWNGPLEKIFDGCLLWTGSGSGYISRNGEIPENSVGFWMPDLPLNRNDFRNDNANKVRYLYNLTRKITFVGFQAPLSIIPAGTLTRVSLARWWSPNEDEPRCYLQLSGWYL